MKGVIIAAGYGTRFLPVTKVVPKELLPIIDTPTIDYIVNEFIHAGIKDIIIITSRRKRSIEDYYDREIELETVFQKEQNISKLNKIKTKENINFSFIRQQEMLGTGHAMLLLKPFVGDSPFIIAYPDDLFTGVNVSDVLIEAYEKEKKSVIAVEQMDGDVSPYGVVEVSCSGSTPGLMKLKKIIEKPPRGSEPSNLVSVGRYLFTPEIFEHLEQGLLNHKSGEYYHIYALNTLAKKDRILCALYNGKRYDTGTPIKYLETVIDFALEREDTRDHFKNYILEKVKEIK